MSNAKMYSQKDNVKTKSLSKTKQNQEELDFRREQTQILQTKRKMNSANGLTEIAKSNVVTTKVFKNESKAKNLDSSFALNTKSNGKETPSQLIKKLRQSYELNNVVAFNVSLEHLQKKSPKNPFLPELYYLKGLMQLSNKNYGLALKSFNYVVKKYPRSQYASQSLFAKGVTFQRMGFRSPAIAIFEDIRRRYPKSLEAQRAQLEIKIMDKKIQ